MSAVPFDPRGILLRRDAVRAGLDDNWLGRMVRTGELVRMRHGAYVDPSVWNPAPRAERHRLLSAAVLQQYDQRVALSHTSAHVMRGGPDYGLDLTHVHLTNLFGRGDRIQAGITHHRGWIGVTDVSRWGPHWITAGARTAVDTAALAPPVPAVCVLDWTLNQGLTTEVESTRYAEWYMREWPDTIGLPIAVARSDRRSESVGETRTRLALDDLGFRVVPQWRVHHPSGHLAGIVDLVLPDEGVLVEFDGKIKYGRLFRPGQTISDVIEAERRRELVLEELTGMLMLRVVWADLDDHAELGARVRRRAAQFRRRAG